MESGSVHGKVVFVDSCVLVWGSGICGRFPKQCRGRTSHIAR